MLKKLLLLFLFVLPIAVVAQTALTGNVFDNDNRSTTIEGAAIRNLTNKSFSLTDKNGHFVITAKVGDLISFGMAGYHTDTVYLINLFPKNVYLRIQVNTLNTINVTTTKLSPFLDLRNPNTTPSRPVEYSKERGGLRLNLGYGRYRKDQAKIRALEENEDYQEEISEKFNEEYIKKLVKFEGKNIKDFMDMYRPTVDQVKAERPFNYDYYIAKAYRTWLKLPEDQRKLPSLLKRKVN